MSMMNMMDSLFLTVPLHKRPTGLVLLDWIIIRWERTLHILCKAKYLFITLIYLFSSRYTNYGKRQAWRRSSTK